MKQAVLQHFQSFLGTNKLVMSKGGIDVYQWPHPVNRHTVILTTVGMAEDSPVVTGAKQDVHHPSEVELMMFSRPQDVLTLAQFMIDMSAYPKRAKTRLHWWHVVPLGRP